MIFPDIKLFHLFVILCCFALSVGGLYFLKNNKVQSFLEIIPAFLFSILTYCSGAVFVLLAVIYWQQNF